MLFDVYVYRDDPVDSLSEGPKTGELVLKAAGTDRGITCHLYAVGSKEELLRSMHHVRLVAMNSSSLVIEGTVTIAVRNTNKSKANSFKVQWVVKHVGAPAVVDAKRLQRRSASRLAKVLASGFDPADDNKNF